MSGLKKSTQQGKIWLKHASRVWVTYCIYILFIYCLTKVEYICWPEHRQISIGQFAFTTRCYRCYVIYKILFFQSVKSIHHLRLMVSYLSLYNKGLRDKIIVCNFFMLTVTVSYRFIYIYTRTPIFLLNVWYQVNTVHQRWLCFEHRASMTWIQRPPIENSK